VSYLRVGAPAAEPLSKCASQPARDPVALEGQRAPPAWVRNQKMRQGCYQINDQRWGDC
jgi:hypothetical protein